MPDKYGAKSGFRVDAGDGPFSAFRRDAAPFDHPYYNVLGSLSPPRIDPEVARENAALNPSYSGIDDLYRAELARWKLNQATMGQPFLDFSLGALKHMPRAVEAPAPAPARGGPVDMTGRPQWDPTRKRWIAPVSGGGQWEDPTQGGP